MTPHPTESTSNNVKKSILQIAQNFRFKLEGWHRSRQKSQSEAEIVHQESDFVLQGTVVWIGGIRRFADPLVSEGMAVRVYFAIWEKGTAQYRITHVVETALGNLPRYQIGSVWDKGVRVKSPVESGAVENFTFEPQKIELVNFASCVPGSTRGDYIFTNDTYPIPRHTGGGLNFAHIRVTRSDGTSYIILLPCTELYRFVCGASNRLLDQVVLGGLKSRDPLLQTHVPEATMWTYDPKTLYLTLGISSFASDARLIGRIVADPELLRMCHSVHLYQSVAVASDFGCPIKMDIPASKKTRLSATGRYFRSTNGSAYFLVERLVSFETEAEPFAIVYRQGTDNVTCVSKGESGESLLPRHRYGFHATTSKAVSPRR